VKKLCALLFVVALLSACEETPNTVMVIDITGQDLPDFPDADASGSLDFLPGDGAHDSTACIPGTPCSSENEFGVCDGEWTCDPKDGPLCSALVAAEEVCDGIDNDCDGTVDDIPCDDLDICTSGDHCLDGTCDGTALTCDDENPCTEDSCDAEQGCVNSALSDTLCDDGDACTTEDFCDDGLCTGAAVACNDEDPCTMDFCNSASGCVFEPTDSLCDDGDPCTVGDLCSGGICEGTPISCDCLTDEECEDLEDGDLCNGTLVCDLDQFPPKCAVDEETLIECPAPDGIDAECLEAVCAADTGECSLVPANESKACSDGDACTISDICEAGECYSAKPLNCNDGNPCTDDICSPELGCHSVSNSASCSDGDACTKLDACEDGACLGGEAVICDDLNPCTDDSCDPAAGCLFVPNTLPCSDANACTFDEYCADGTCKNGKPLDCDDNDLCTTDSCSPAEGCVHAANSVPCDDGDACTNGDHCSDGSCLPGKLTDCDDGNPCTNDLCDADSGCLHTDNVEPCDDNNSCTINDTCLDGNCVGEGSLDCDDDNLCTNDICLPDGGCQHEDVAGPCSDGDNCTVNDSCAEGVCVSGSPLNCDDNDSCTSDSCTDGLCEHTAADGDCDDENLCTIDDACLEGICQGGSLLDCDDANPCTTDSCNPLTGCIHTPSANPCDDGNACTIGDTCADGLCVGAGSLDCDDGNFCTTDSCDPDSGCSHIFNADPCDDGNACTTTDLCLGGLCIGTELVSCDDDNECTDDSCAPLSGCVHTNSEVPCEDGNLCTTGDICSQGLCVAGPALVCNDGNVCTDDSCDVDEGCLFQANDAGCDDGNACTTGDSCVAGACAGGAPPDCDDGNVCTNDGCDWQTGCLHQNNTEACDDDTVCTQTDLCKDGICVGSNPLSCDDSNKCTEDSCNLELGCEHMPIVPCCGDESIDGDEECDNGADNGAIGLDTCNATCQINSRYELVMRMATSGQVLDGTFDEALDRVVTKAQDCVVRADGRVAQVKHIEYAFNTIRFDFQPLHAYHNTWDSYAYIELRNNVRAGIGATYRRGHASYVWRKDFAQNSEAAWLPAEASLYCERESRFEKVSSFKADGTSLTGMELGDLISLVAEDGVECKVRYDSRVSDVDHIEYGESHIFFDFLPLHAPYNTWDSYAYVTVDKTRAALAAAYRRGHPDTVYKLDRQQHNQAYVVNTPVDVFCRKWTPTIVSSDGAAFTAGDFDAAYKAVVTEARDCRIGFDSRVATPQYVEYTNGTLVFEFVNLRAPYDGWEAFARISLSSDGKAELQTKRRRGHYNNIYKKSDGQDNVSYKAAMAIDLYCDGEHAPAHAITVTSAGAVAAGDWDNFHGGMTDISKVYDCRMRVDGRVLYPQLTELAAADQPQYFDMAGLSGYYNSWEAYAGVVLQNNSQSAIYSSMRRGYGTEVWKKGRSQYAVQQTLNTTSEFICE
jgi:hypothetical protein